LVCYVPAYQCHPGQTAVAFNIAAVISRQPAVLGMGQLFAVAP